MDFFIRNKAAQDILTGDLNPQKLETLKGIFYASKDKQLNKHITRSGRDFLGIVLHKFRVTLPLI